MPVNNNEKDEKSLVKGEVEIDNILEETKFLTDQENMGKTAEKYRVKPPVEDIFSNADCKPRLENTNPLDIDKDDRTNKLSYTGNEIASDKTAATLQATLILDGKDDVEIVTHQQLVENVNVKDLKNTENIKNENDINNIEISENNIKNINTDQKTGNEENNDKISKNDVEDKNKKDKENIEKNQKNSIINSASQNIENTNSVDDNADEYVSLTPEYSAETKFSDKVIDEVDQFEERETKIESIHSIDIQMDDKAEEIRQHNDKEKEKIDKIISPKNLNDGKPHKKHISKVPIYKVKDDENVINIKAGKFSDVVSFEYEQYIKSKNPSVISQVIKQETVVNTYIEDDEVKDSRTKGERLMAGLVGFFSNDESDDQDTPVEKEVVDDYTGEDDEQSIMQEINLNIHKLFARSLLTGAIALFSILLCVLTRFLPEQICGTVKYAPVVFAVLNVLVVGFSIFVNKISIMGGLTLLSKFKGNSDTAVTVAMLATAIQSITSFFNIDTMETFTVNYYTPIVMCAFFANTVGKLLMVLRVKDNFKFVASNSQKYAAKIYNNETIANQMMSGTAIDRAFIAYQHRTGFPSNFLKISYAPDPSEELASKLAPITTIVATIISVIYGGIFASFTGAINTFALLTAISVPIATLVSVNIPMRILSKKLLSFGAMLSGYPSVKQFCDSSAIMIDCNELFPSDSVFLDGIKTYEEYNIDESLMCAIAVLKEAEHPIAKVFDSVVDEKGDLPEVESVLYEDGMGLVGWINGERILVGNQELMTKYVVDIPDANYEDSYKAKGKQVTYAARAGRIIAMFVTHYTTNKILKNEIQRAEANGMSFLVRTTDCNITGDLISELYEVFYRSIKVLPTGLGYVLKESQNTFEETSRAYLITTGKVSSLSRAVSGSINIQQTISISVIIQIISIILGLLVCATLVLYAGVGVMGAFEVFLYSLVWGVSTLVLPAVKKH